MSGGEGTERIAIEGNMMDRMAELEEKVEAILNGNVRSSSLDMLVEDTDLIGYRLIAVPEGATQLEPTASDFTGAFLAGIVQAMFDATQDAWLAKINAGEVEFSVGIEGIYQNRLTNGYKHIADDGTTYRKGELGMTTLEGQSAPSFGLSYTENASGTELITNGGFEAGDFTGWTTVSGSPQVLSDDVMDGKEGTYYAKLSGAQISQSPNVTPDSVLVVSALMQASGGSGSIFISFYTGAGGSGSFVSGDSFTITTTNTISRTKTFVVPATAGSVVIAVFDSSPFVMVDSISVLDYGVGPFNYFGFEPERGKLISKMLDDASLGYGQLPVGAMSVPRVDEAKDKLVASSGGAGNVNVGTHGVITTFVDEYGETDADLTQRSTVDVLTSAKIVNLSSIPIGKWGTTQRKVYATIANAATTVAANYYLVTTINDNTTTTGTYNISDATLVTGAQIPTVNTTGSRPAFPKRWACFGDDIITSVTMTNNITAGLTHNYGFYVGPTAANAADGNLYTADVFIEAGSYTLYHYGVTTPDSGKLDYYIDNVLVQSGVDWYSAGGTFNVTKSFTLTIPTSGYHILEMKVNGQNASATDYRVFFTKITLRPTAY